MGDYHFAGIQPGRCRVPRPANKPLTHDDILYLLNNYVPSQSVTNLVKENGIDFEPEDNYLKKVKAAGGREELLAALRTVHGSGPRPAAVQRSAGDLSVEQHLTRAMELEKLESYPQAEQEYRTALAIQPQNSTLHVGLGALPCQAGKVGRCSGGIP